MATGGRQKNERAEAMLKAQLPGKPQRRKILRLLRDDVLFTFNQHKKDEGIKWFRLNSGT